MFFLVLIPAFQLITDGTAQGYMLGQGSNSTNNDESCISNDEFALKLMKFVFQMMNTPRTRRIDGLQLAILRSNRSLDGDCLLILYCIGIV